jgi:hypothetical protein
MTFKLNRPASATDIAMLTGLTSTEVADLARRNRVKPGIRIGRRPFWGERETAQLIGLTEVHPSRWEHSRRAAQ